MSAMLAMAVRAAVRRLLVPLARLLIESGIGVKEFQALAKLAFVHAARDLSPNPHRPSASRIAAITGLRRMEVAKLLVEDAAVSPEALAGRQQLERVLQGWWSDADFHDAHGDPAPLALRGTRHCFATLVERYSGDSRVVTILDELTRAKAVRTLPDGTLEVLSRTYVTARWDTAAVESFGERVREQIDTLLHNLKHPSRPRYARMIVNPRLDPHRAATMVRDIGEQAETLINSLDDALNDPAATLRATAQPQDALRLGLAVYVFEEPVVIEKPTAPKISSPPPAARQARKP